MTKRNITDDQIESCILDFETYVIRMKKILFSQKTGISSNNDYWDAVLLDIDNRTRDLKRIIKENSD